jgi:nitrite reductase/ring-hydroxylating ferredoxin subunit/uncharacterized membrane protein
MVLVALKTRPSGAKRAAASLPPLLRETLVERLEKLRFLDRPAELLQKGIRAVVPSGTAAKDVLSGTWLGHPVHPPLTDIVIGSWTSAWFLDSFGGRRMVPAADALVAVGIVAAVPTAATGASDWAELKDGTRRVGLVHALGNTTALTLQIGSFVARRQGRRARGVGLSMVAMGVASLSAWLGGHLSFGRGVGVNQTAFEDFPSAWTSVAVEDAVETGKPVRRSVGGHGVVLVRQGGRIHALADRCSHRGCSLADGTVAGGRLTCACHGSTYELADGSVVKGPATAPQPTLEVRISGGMVEVRGRQGA